jgi:hypothetical protein
MSVLDTLSNIPAIHRIVFEYTVGEDPPVPWVNLEDVGVYLEDLKWVENDEHFRGRVNEHKK